MRAVDGLWVRRAAGREAQAQAYARAKQFGPRLAVLGGTNWLLFFWEANFLLSASSSQATILLFITASHKKKQRQYMFKMTHLLIKREHMYSVHV